MSSKHSVEEDVAYDKRPKIIAGVVGLLAVVAVVIFIAAVIASGFVTG